MRDIKNYQMLINGDWVDASDGGVFESINPSTQTVWSRVPEATEEDVNRAVSAAHNASSEGPWSKLTPTERGKCLRKLGDLLADHSENLGRIETIDTGKMLKETRWQAKYIAEFFHFFAGCADKVSGETLPIDKPDMFVFTKREPLGVVAAVVPWNSQLFLVAVKIGPALAAGNTVVLKASEHASAAMLEFGKLIEQAGIPPGVVNIVSGFGLEAGKPLASSDRIAKIAFTGETTTGRLIMQYAAQNLIPITLELGGKSPNVFFEDIMDKDDAFLDKCVEGFVMFNLNQGEVCTCPSRALVQESIYDKFMEKVIARTKAVVQDNPLKMETMIGAQASVEQMEKIKSYLDLGKKEGAKVLCGGDVAKLNSGLENGNYIQPTIFEGDNSMRIFQEEIFGPVVSVTKFKDEAHALEIANDTLYGLGAGVWTRNGNIAYRMGRGIQAGIVWTNCYHAYPAHSPFGGYKQSGVGRETHKMMLNHYRQNKNLHVSYAENKLGFF